jgi:hypothetical protein
MAIVILISEAIFVVLVLGLLAGQAGASSKWG